MLSILSRGVRHALIQVKPCGMHGMSSPVEDRKRMSEVISQNPPNENRPLSGLVWASPAVVDVQPLFQHMSTVSPPQPGAELGYRGALP